MLDEELNRFVTEWLPRSTANILYKPITWKASVGHSLQSVQVKHKSIQHTDVIQRDNKRKNIHATHIATNKWCTKWNSSEQQSVSAGLQHFIAISTKWRQHFVRSPARVRTRCKSVPSGESLWSLELRGQFYLQKNSCGIIPHKLTHSHTKTHTQTIHALFEAGPGEVKGQIGQ